MPTWIYLGNSPTQINNTSTPATNPTSWTEAQVLVGRTYDSSIMQGVNVQGTPTNSGGANFGRGTDSLTYSLVDNPNTPVNEAKTATSVYTSHVVVNLTITVGRMEAGHWVEAQRTLQGVIIQMRNGDTFLRPYYNTVDQWETTLSNWGIVEVHVDSVPRPTAPSTIANPNTTDAYTGGLNATASFPPRLVGRPVDVPNPCFVAGTLILTDKGLVPVETIRAGDLIVTMDAGLQPVRWVGSRTLDLGHFKLQPGASMAPVCIAAGSLGEGQPARDLQVSPQHRVLVRSKIAQRMFGSTEVLVPAKSLIGLEGIEQMHETREVTYVHFIFDAHQIVYAEGAALESFYPGREALLSIGQRARDELFAIFPELAMAEVPPPARAFIPSKKAQQLTARHVANQKPVVFQA